MPKIPLDHPLEDAWKQLCKLIDDDDAMPAVPSLGDAFRRFSDNHQTDPDHIANVVSALRRAVPLLLAALGWQDVRAGGSAETFTPTDEARGEQWRLVMAYGGFETLVRALLIPKQPGLGRTEFEVITSVCDLPTYSPLAAPKHATKEREQWFDSSNTEAPEDLLQFLGLKNGAARVITRWLAAGQSVEDWPNALDLARSLRHATAHGALSASRAAQWKLREPLRRLVNDLVTVAAAALRQVLKVVTPEPAVGAQLEAQPVALLKNQKLTLGADSLVTELAFSPNGTLLACGLNGGKALLFDLASGQVLKQLKLPTKSDRETSVTFSPDGRRFAAGSADQLRVWSLPTNDVPADAGAALTLPYADFFFMLQSVCFSPNSSELAAARGKLSLFRMNDSPKKPAQELVSPKSVGAQTEPSHAGYLHSGAAIVAISWGYKITRWNLPSGKVAWAVRHPDLSGSVRRIGPRALAVSPDDKLIAVGSCDRGDVLLLDAATGSVARRLTASGETRSLAFSPNGRFLFAGIARGGRAGDAEVFDLQGRKKTTDLRISVLGKGERSDTDTGVAVHPTQPFFAAGVGSHIYLRRYDGGS